MQTDRQAPMLDNRIHQQCLEAEQLEQSGDYELAREALSGIWTRIGERPRLDGLTESVSSEVLLRVGILAGFIGSARQMEGAQEFAKDLLSEARQGFERLKRPDKIAECYNALAVCYWREGALDEARLLLKQSIELIGDPVNEQYLNALVNLGMVERSNGNYPAALRLCSEALPSVVASTSHALKARFYNGSGVTWKNMGQIDEALIDFEAASYHFEQTEHKRFCARVENNIGNLLIQVGRFAAAHAHLEKAIHIFERLKDMGGIAIAMETRARAYLYEDKLNEAEACARRSISLFDQGDEYAQLIEALITEGTILSRLGKTMESLMTFFRAHHLATERLSKEAANNVIQILSQQIYLKSNLGFVSEVHRFEESLIRDALEASEGAISRAAKLLGLASHQALADMLNNRHCALQGARKPIRRRGKSIINAELAKKNSIADNLYFLPRKESPSLLLPPEFPPDREYIALQLYNECLAELNIHLGDWLIVMAADYEQGDLVAVREVSSNHVYAAGYIFEEFGMYRLDAANPDYEPLPYQLNEIEVMGVIIGYCHDPLTPDSIFFSIGRPHDEQ
jgi:tetratricopeptide (TPR) repeat protein